MVISGPLPSASNGITVGLSQLYDIRLTTSLAPLRTTTILVVSGLVQTFLVHPSTTFSLTPWHGMR